MNASLSTCQALALLAALTIFTSATSSPDSRRPVPTTPNLRYIASSCHVTLYPHECYHSLSLYARRIKRSPNILIHTALVVTQRAAMSASRTARRAARLRGLRPKEASAIKDCADVVGESVYELGRSVGEVGLVVRAGLRLNRIHVSNVQTWVSSALTDASTCLDGLDESKMRLNVKAAVGVQMVKVSRLASNALALINRYPKGP